MLFFYSGNDFKNKKREIDKVLKILKEKKDSANFFHYDSFDLSLEKLDEMLEKQGLFEIKNIYYLSNTFEKKEFKEWFFKNLEKIEENQSAWIFSEEKINKNEENKIQKIAYKFENFEKKIKEKINPFLLSDYLQTKNILKAWEFYHQLLKKNKADEIFNIIFWSFKNLAIAEKFSQSDSGLNSYPYQKAKRNLKFWKE